MQLQRTARPLPTSLAAACDFGAGPLLHTFFAGALVENVTVRDTVTASESERSVSPRSPDGTRAWPANRAAA